AFLARRQLPEGGTRDLLLFPLRNLPLLRCFPLIDSDGGQGPAVGREGEGREGPPSVRLPRDRRHPFPLHSQPPPDPRSRLPGQETAVGRQDAVMDRGLRLAEGAYPLAGIEIPQAGPVPVVCRIEFTISHHRSEDGTSVSPRKGEAQKLAAGGPG